MEFFTNFLPQALESDLFVGGLLLAILTTITAIVFRLWKTFSVILRRVLSQAFVVKLEMSGPNELTSALVMWALDQRYVFRRRILFAHVDNSLETGNRLVMSVGTGKTVIWYKRRPIWISVSRANDGEKRGRTEDITLQTLGRSLHLLEEICALAYATRQVPPKDRLICYVPGPFDKWEFQRYLPRRKPGTLVLSKGKFENLHSDLEAFLAAKDNYRRLGIPWRRGYLLHGPPGTGKSSTVLALASEMSLNIARLNLAQTNLGHGDFCSLLANTPSPSIILIEDIDDAFYHRESKEAKTNFAEFLNGIDGVSAYEGNVIFMTTNRLEKLDPALIRPGRVDIMVEIGYADEYQMRHMFLRFFPGHSKQADCFAKTLKGEKISGAELQRYLFLRYRNPTQALDESALFLGENLPVGVDRHNNKLVKDRSISQIKTDAAVAETQDPNTAPQESPVTLRN